MRITSLANDLYDKSAAYFTLRKLYIPPERVLQQPIIVFTDASYKEHNDYASFSIVVENIFKDFHILEQIIEKYNLN